jgi:diguanylate cyclase (GGDEF)-like protein
MQPTGEQMCSAWCNRLHRRVRAWQLLRLPRWLVALIAAVVAADAAAIGITASNTAFRATDLMLFGALLICGAVTVELTRRAGENALLVKNVFAVWELPMVILLPPVFALIAPIPRFVLTQWRIRQIAPHRRVYSAAVISLSYGAAYLAWHDLARGQVFRFPAGAPGFPLTGPAWWTAAAILAVVGCFALQWFVNNSLVFAAVKGSEPGASIRGMLLARESMLNDVTEICVATLVTVGIAASPVTIFIALPLVTLLQRSSRHAQLVTESRVDAKTGLLNAMTWRRESSCEVDRARRTGSALAVVLVDIDHFKGVNDTFGHLAGDEALHAVGQVMRQAVRQYDLVGRFGGEEFSLLLRDTDAAAARVIAERIRAGVAALRVDPGIPTAGPITLTVSVGVAALGNGSSGQITELLAAADAALYRAKRSGRNQVWLTTETTSASTAARSARAGYPPR